MQKIHQTQQDKRGFTLIELLVVISIIGVLTALLLANFVGIRERASDAKLKNDLVQLKSALRLYYNDYQVYPANNAQTTMFLGCGAAGTTACTVGSAFTAGTSTYMKAIPDIGHYERTGSGDGFLTCADLQNTGDSDITESQDLCVPSSGGSETTTITEASYCVCSD